MVLAFLASVGSPALGVLALVVGNMIGWFVLLAGLGGSGVGFGLSFQTVL